MAYYEAKQCSCFQKCRKAKEKNKNETQVYNGETKTNVDSGTPLLGASGWSNTDLDKVLPNPLREK